MSLTEPGVWIHTGYESEGGSERWSEGPGFKSYTWIPIPIFMVPSMTYIALCLRVCTCTGFSVLIIIIILL